MLHLNLCTAHYTFVPTTSAFLSSRYVDMFSWELFMKTYRISQKTHNYEPLQKKNKKDSWSLFAVWGWIEVYYNIPVMCNKKRFEQCAGQKDTSKGQHFSSSYGRGFAFATWCFFSHLTVFFFHSWTSCLCDHCWSRFDWEAGFWTFREKSTTGQPCVMQPREMMSTWGEKYKDRFSGITPPLASIFADGNSCFSAWAAACNSCRLEGWRTGWEEVCQWTQARSQAWTLLYLRMEVVQHYNVCSCSGCLSGLFCWTTLYLNLTTETRHRAGDFHGLEKQTRFMFWVSLQIMNVL